MIQFDQNQQILYSTLIDDDTFISGFGTKDLGDGMNHQILTAFFDTNDIRYRTMVLLEQIQSVNIAQFERQTDSVIETIEETDGVITDSPQTVILVRTADCVPILFCDKVKKRIGISHQGWRGSLKQMPIRMIKKMEEMGSVRDDIIVVIGPAIGVCCYEIDDDFYYRFLEEFNEYASYIFSMVKGKRHLNLLALNYLLLTANGIKKENVDYFPFCTSCDIKRFFSFRRDHKRNISGEMFNYIMINN